MICSRQYRCVESEISSTASQSTAKTVNCKDSLATRRTKTQLLVLRILVLVSLFITAVICGAVSYILFTYVEEKNFKSHYTSISTTLERSVDGILDKYKHSADEAAIFSITYYSDPDIWPNCAIPNFHLLSEDILAVTGGSAISVVPIVYPDQQAAFESYAVDYIAKDPFLSSYTQAFSYHNISGVFNVTDDLSLRHATGDNPFSSRQFVAPLLNVGASSTQAGILLLDTRSVSVVAEAMDSSIDCYEEGHSSCASMTYFTSDVSGNPETSLYRPIVSLNNERDLLGFSFVSFNWASELKKVSPGASLVVVLSCSNGKLHSFAIEKNNARYMGAGDYHDKKFSRLRSRHTIMINTFAKDSAVYIMETYPTAEFAAEYLSYKPLYTSLGSVGLIIFTSVIFFTYDSLVKAEERAKLHLLKIKRDFVRFISHEIRTPLNTVAVGLHLMEDNILKNREVEPIDAVELRRDMHSGVEIAVSVLNDLLNFDKLEAGEFNMSTTPVRIWNLVEDVTRSFRNIALRKNITMSSLFVIEANYTYNHNKIVVLGDYMKLSQVVRNLVSNALKFTDCGGWVTVTVTWRDFPQESKELLHESSMSPQEADEIRAGNVIIAVQDTGYGLSKENLRLLFRDGMQFKPNELQAGQGSGLGLFLSFQIVQMHGGRMWATSEGESKGSTFYVELPVFLTKRSATDSRRALSAGRIDPIVSPSAENIFPRSDRTELVRKTILVVDDTNSNRKMVCRTLRNRGARCIEAHDGQECISIVTCGETLFDCILMDFEMPIMNGPDATKELRKLGYTLPIIGLTGNVMVDDVHYFLSSGADHVLPKPFQMEQFVSIINDTESE